MDYEKYFIELDDAKARLLNSDNELDEKLAEREIKKINQKIEQLPLA